MADLIRYPYTDEGLSDCMTALGSTADAVATVLRGWNFTGWRGSCSTCPVASYINASVDLPPGAAVHVYQDLGSETQPHVTAGRPGHPNDVSAIGPRAVGDFINAFDAGCYPDLIEGERHA